jgi:hypothetical protein
MMLQIQMFRVLSRLPMAPVMLPLNSMDFGKVRLAAKAS